MSNVIVDVGVTVSLALEFGCGVVEPNSIELVPKELVTIADDDVFGIEFVVVTVMDVVFRVLKVLVNERELPSPLPKEDVFGRLEGGLEVVEAPPKIFLPASKVKVGALNMDVVDVVWPNIGCPVILEAAVCVI